MYSVASPSLFPFMHLPQKAPRYVPTCAGSSTIPRSRRRLLIEASLRYENNQTTKNRSGRQISGGHSCFTGLYVRFIRLVLR